MDKIFNKIVELSNKEDASILHCVAKLSEETGELSSAILLKDGYKLNKYSLTESEIETEILDEGADSILVLIDLLNKAGFSIEDIKSSLEKKMIAWENVIEKHSTKD